MFLTQTLDAAKVLTDKELSEISALEQNVLTCSDEEFYRKLHMTANLIVSGTFPGQVIDEILSKEKDFNKSAVLRNVALNRRGLCAFRVTYAHYAYERRCAMATYKLHPVRKQGLFLIDDYLGLYERKKISDEIDEAYGTLNKQPHTLLKNLNPDRYPELLFLLNNSGFKQTILESASYSMLHKPALLELEKNTFVQRVVNEPDDDEQKDIHSDIFYPAIKFWYFPKAVNSGEGTFCYAKFKGLTVDLVKLFYRASLEAAEYNYEEWKRRSHREGSYRINEAQLAELGLHLEEVPAAANTLVIANVFGFHCRGQVKQRAERLSVHGSIRHPQPFDLNVY